METTNQKSQTANDNLEIIIERLSETDEDIRQNALNMLIDMVKSSHSGSISTLSFQTFLDKKHIFVDICSSLSDSQRKSLFDVISAISIIGEEVDILRYRILGNVLPLEIWGHLYVKKLVGCIVECKKGKCDCDYASTKNVSKACVDFLFDNNMEVDGIDFLLELEEIEEIVKYVSRHNYTRIVLYLEEMSVFYRLKDVLSKIYLKVMDYSRFVVSLIDQNRRDEAVQFVKAVKDDNTRHQLLYILCRLNIYYYSDNEEDMLILSNGHVKDIYKRVIMTYELDAANEKNQALSKIRYEKDLKSTQRNSFCAITLSNGFMNLGYGKDKIFFVGENKLEGSDYQNILKSNIPELVTIVGSIGCIEYWNPARVFEILQENIFASPSREKTSALLALALSGSKCPDYVETITPLLIDYLMNMESMQDSLDVIPILLGLQLLYSGAGTKEIRQLLIPYLSSTNAEIAFFTAFTLGSLFVGSGDSELISIFLQIYIEKEAFIDSHFFRFLMLGIALLFYRRPDLECCLESMETTHARHGSILVKGFQYIKTGDSSVVDQIMSTAFSEESDALLESIALLSCCLIGIGDDLASVMISRICASSLLLESTHLKVVLPLCYALLNPSSPQSSILESIERNMSSGDTSIAMSSIYGLSIIGAGTVSGKIQRIIDSQYSQFYKESKVNSILRISTGLVSLGRGLSSVSMCLYDKSCLLPKNFIGLFATTFLMLEPFTSPLFNENSYLFYLLTQSFVPKYVYTGKDTNVRIGLPVNTVGLVGEPRRISSMQTHTMPVILNCTERAELDEEAYTSFIEDIVLIKE